MSKQYWLFKSEPDEFSIDDLEKAKDKTTYWDGVRNYQARNYLRDSIKNGDGVLFYHSNSEPLAVVGICKVVKEGYPDFTAFDPKDKHYDEKSNPQNPTWFMVDIKLERKLKKPVTLEAMKQNHKLNTLKLLQKGNRLSVMPVTNDEWDEILLMEKNNH